MFFLNFQLRPFIFFSSMGELMSLYWSGSAEQKTSALQVLTKIKSIQTFRKTAFFLFFRVIFFCKRANWNIFFPMASKYQCLMKVPYHLISQDRYYIYIKLIYFQNSCFAIVLGQNFNLEQTVRFHCWKYCGLCHVSIHFIELSKAATIYTRNQNWYKGMINYIN